MCFDGPPSHTRNVVVIEVSTPVAHGSGMFAPGCHPILHCFFSSVPFRPVRRKSAEERAQDPVTYEGRTKLGHRESERREKGHKSHSAGSLRPVAGDRRSSVNDGLQ